MHHYSGIDRVRALPGGKKKHHHGVKRRRPAPVAPRLEGLGEMGFSFKKIGRAIGKGAKSVGKGAAKVTKATGRATFKAAKTTGRTGFKVSKFAAKTAIKPHAFVAKTTFSLAKKGGKLGVRGVKAGAKAVKRNPLRTGLLLAGGAPILLAATAGKKLGKKLPSRGGASFLKKTSRGLFGPKLPKSIPTPNGDVVRPEELEAQTGVPAEAISAAAIAANKAGDDPEARAEAVDAVEAEYGLEDDALTSIAEATDTGGDTEEEASDDEGGDAEDVDAADGGDGKPAPEDEEAEEVDADDGGEGGDAEDIAGISDLEAFRIGKALKSAGRGIGKGAKAIGKGAKSVGKVAGKGAVAGGKLAIQAAASRYLGIGPSTGGGYEPQRAGFDLGASGPFLIGGAALAGLWYVTSHKGGARR